MVFKTFGALKAEVQAETDTEAEEFVVESEIMAYFQEAVDECAAHIYKCWPVACHYFETLVKSNLTLGQQAVTLPEDLYARAILRVILNGNGKVLTIPGSKIRSALKISQVSLSSILREITISTSF
jgi:hypothetical protein